MKLANKTFVIIAAILGILIIGQVYLAREILMSGFDKLEKRDATASVERFRDAMQEQIDSLAIKVIDWSVWDDAYNYVNTRSKEFEESNLKDNTMPNMKLQLFVFLDAKHNVVFGKIVDPQGNAVSIPPSVRIYLQQHPDLYAFRDESHHINGVAILDGHPMLISSQPIIKSDGSGPIAGAIIFGRYLDQVAIEKLSHLIHLSLMIAPANRTIPANIAKAAPSLRVPEDIVITVTSEELLTGYVFYNDLYGEKCFYTAIQIPRDVHKQAEATMVAFLSTMLIGGLFLTIITYWAMNRSVVQPIIGLNQKIHAIGENVSLSMRLPVEGHDEIASLALEVNQMLGHIEESKTSVQRLLDNTKQGFFIFGTDGLIANDFSRSVLDIFGANPAGKHIAGLLQEEPGVWGNFSKSLFAEDLPFTELIVLCPNLLQVNGRFIELEYIDIRNQERRITHIMVVATDVTALRVLMKQKEEENGMNRILIKILSAKNDFLEALALLRGLTEVQHNLAEFRRRLHTLKGCFHTLTCISFAKSCHAWEERLAQNPTTEIASAALMAITEEVETFIESHDSLLKISAHTGTVRTIASQEIHDVINEAVRHDIAPAIMNKLRLMAEMPVREALGWLDDAFLAAATKAGKEGLPALWLPSAAIDPDLYAGLIRSLIHIPRNAAGHGLELPEEREALGKPRAGRLTIQLELKDDTYSLVICDDGAGIDVTKVAAKAIQLGLPSPQTREDAFELLFRDGFSTKDTISDLSGRGVGLSAVRSEAQMLCGDVLIDSIEGKGTQVTVRFKRQDPWIAEKRNLGIGIPRVV